MIQERPDFFRRRTSIKPSPDLDRAWQDAQPLIEGGNQTFYHRFVIIYLGLLGGGTTIADMLDDTFLHQENIRASQEKLLLTNVINELTKSRSPLIEKRGSQYYLTQTGRAVFELLVESGFSDAQ